jgi:hypothetical protein
LFKVAEWVLTQKRKSLTKSAQKNGSTCLLEVEPFFAVQDSRVPG